MKNQKCLSVVHEDFDAIKFCEKCRIYMCNKCEGFDSILFKSHHSFNIDKGLNDTFTGFCNKENHYDKLEFFCKNHNELCCSSCLCKLKGKGKGQHSDCDVCFIEDIKNEKANKLSSNIKILEELLNRIQYSLNELKIIIEKIEQKKENIKLKIQKIY